MYLVTLDGLTASAFSHEQYVDAAGVAWICQDVQGWFRAPGRRTKHTERPSGDGAHRSDAFRETRSFTVKGRFFTGDPVLGDTTTETVLGLMPDGGRRYPLTVQQRNGRNLTAYVEQGAGEILCEQGGPGFWDYSIPCVSSDSYRFAAAWTTGTGPTPGAGSGGIDFSGSGASFAAPGLAMGTAPINADVTVQGLGNGGTQLVFEVVGSYSGPTIRDINGVAALAVAGEIPQGSSLFINASPMSARDVPGALGVIPPYGALLGEASARGALRIPGGWPAVGPKEIRTFRLTGSAGAGGGFRVHTRPVWV